MKRLRHFRRAIKRWGKDQCLSVVLNCIMLAAVTLICCWMFLFRPAH